MLVGKTISVDVRFPQIAHYIILVLDRQFSESKELVLTF